MQDIFVGCHRSSRAHLEHQRHYHGAAMGTEALRFLIVVRQPYGAWMTQIARNLTDCVDGVLIGKRYLLHDRDPLFTDEFRGVLAAAGVKCLRLPARSPNLNSVAERFVLSIKSECLNKLVPLR